MKTNKENCQSLVEFALVVSMMMLMILGLVSFGMVLLDMHTADASASAAIHAAQIHVIDGNSCLSEAMQAIGNPTFIMAEGATFSITNCSADVNWLGSRGSEIVATWTFTVNPPLPFIYGNFGFPLTLVKTYTAFYAR